MHTRAHPIFVLLVALFTAAVAPATAQSDSQPTQSASAEPSVLYSSTLWNKDTSDITGMWRIETLGNGKRTLILSRDFKTKNAPDLKVVLSPLTTDKISRKTALDNAVVLGALKSNTGSQEYDIPEGLDLARFKSVAIHCEQYTKLWGSSTLSKGEVIAADGEWDKKTKRTTGAYEIVSRDGVLVVRFAEKFKTSKAPEPLHILLSRSAAKDTTNKNAESGATRVATLAKVKGSQEYTLNGVTDLRGYRSILLNCKKYTKLWSAAALAKPTK